MEVVVEVIEPGRRAPSIKRFNKEEISIGRAWSSDLVIVDAEIDPEHARLEFHPESQAFSLEDLGSANGTRHNGRKFADKIQVDFGDSVTVGQTTFRIHRANDPVAPPKTHSRPELFLNKLSHPAMAILLMAVALFLYQSSVFIESGEPFKWENQLQGLLSIATGLFFWAAFWGAITRVIKHQVKFWSHLALVSIVLILFVALNEFESLISFNALSPTLSDLMVALNTAFIIFVWLAVGMAITSNAKSRPRITTAFALAGLYLLTSFLIPRFQTETRVAEIPLKTESRRPGLKVASTQSSDNFLLIVEENMQNTRQRAEELRIENEDN